MHFALLFGLLVMRPLSAHAEFTSEAVVISEIAWAGSSRSAADEWLELTNRGSSAIDVGNWFITGAATSGGSIILPAGTTIASGETLLIANYKLDDANTTLAISPNLSTSAVSLPNETLNLVLATSDGIVLDEIVDGGKPDYGSSTTFASMERQMDGTWTTATTSFNLLDGQLGSPGVTILTSILERDTLPEHATVDVVEAPNDPIVTEPMAIDDPALPVDQLDAPPLVDEPIDAVLDVPVDSQTQTSTSDAQEPIPPAGIIDDSQTVTDITEIPDEAESQQSEQIDLPNETAVEPIAAPGITTQEITEIVTVIEETSSSTSVIDTPISTVETIESVTAAVEVTPAIITTPSEEVPVVTPNTTTCSAQPNFVVLNEILSNPDDGDEWVELANISDIDATLDGCSLRDASQKLTQLSGSILARGYFVITNPNGKLNNDGDTIELMNHGIVLDELTYGDNGIPSPAKGLSIGRDGSTWLVTREPTPGSSNDFIQTIEHDSSATVTEFYENNEVATNVDSSNTIDTRNMPVANAKSSDLSRPPKTETTPTHDRVGYVATPTRISTSTATSSKTTRAKSSTSSSASSIIETTPQNIATLAEGTRVRLEGDVIALPGTFGRQLMYINGLELYMHSANWPDLLLGDHVRISGTVSIANGNHRVKLAATSDIVVEGQSDILPVTTETITDITHGTLVTVSGITEKSGSKIFLRLKNDELIELTGAVSSAQAGDVNITGIVRLSNGNLSLAVREMNELEPIVTGTTMQETIDVSAASSSQRTGVILVLATLAFFAIAYALARFAKHLSFFTTKPTTV